LADQALILTPPGTSTRDLVETALGTIGAQARIAVETNQREAIVPLVLSGAGSTVLPEPLALDALSRGATVRSLRPALSRTLGLIHPADDLSPAAAAFIAVVALASSPSR
jgi:DNA-binding transcriptional LysR family regulator